MLIKGDVAWCVDLCPASAADVAYFIAFLPVAAAYVNFLR